MRYGFLGLGNVVVCVVFILVSIVGLIWLLWFTALLRVEPIGSE